MAHLNTSFNHVSSTDGSSTDGTGMFYNPPKDMNYSTGGPHANIYDIHLSPMNSFNAFRLPNNYVSNAPAPSSHAYNVDMMCEISPSSTYRDGSVQSNMTYRDGSVQSDMACSPDLEQNRDERNPSVQAVRYQAIAEAESIILEKLQINGEKRKLRVFARLNRLRDISANAYELVQRFAMDCYMDSENPLAFAKKYIEVGFGSHELVFAYGPEDAFDYNVDIIADGIMKSERVGDQCVSLKDRYIVVRELGAGATAKVYMAWDCVNDENVALKVYSPEHAPVGVAEARLLQMATHRNVIKVKDIHEHVLWEQSYVTCVVAMELAPGGSFIDVLMNKERLDENVVRAMFKQICDAVLHCHDNGIAHRDIKPDNILIAKNEAGECVMKIADFGAAKEIPERGLMTETFGTAQYAAPEVFRAEPYNESVDTFSLGVVLFTAMALSCPFAKATKDDAWFQRVIDKDWKKFWAVMPEWNTIFAPTAKDLIQKMLEHRPEHRITLAEVVEHPWMKMYKKIDDFEASEVIKSRMKGLGE